MVPDSALNLAACRVIVCGHALWYFVSRDYAGISDLTVLWSFVPVEMQWRFLAFPGLGGLESVLQIVAVVALVLGVAGVYTRPACLVAGLIVYHLAPLESLIWGADATARGLTLTPLALVILAVVPSDHALRIAPRTPDRSVSPDSRYGWPRRLLLLCVAEMYLFSLVGKFMDTGWAWVGPDVLGGWIATLSFPDENVLVRPLARWLSGQGTLLAVLSVGTVVLEAACVVAVFWSRARPLFLVTAIFFHVGIAVTMGIYVGETWLLLLFLDWDVAARLCRLDHLLPARLREV